MKAWLQEFRRRRDAGLTLGESRRVREGHKTVFTYDIRANLHASLWHTGHVRAALLRAVGEDRACMYVDVPLPFDGRDEMTRFYNDSYFELVNGGFSPCTYEPYRHEGVSTLTVSLFSEEDMIELAREEMLLKTQFGP